MKIHKLKIINKPKFNNGVIYSKLQLANPIPCIGNFDPNNIIRTKISSKWYLVAKDINKKDSRTKYYKNKIKSI